jgi:hypothetical protein
MKVEELENYGKDLLSIQEHSQMPLRQKLRLLTPVLGYLRSVVRTLGVDGAVRLVKNVKQEIRSTKGRDWSRLQAKGISPEHLEGIIKKIAIAKAMANMMGMEKAVELRSELSRRISIPVFEAMFAPAEVFIQCGDGDFLPPFKQYYVALMEAMALKGLEEARVVQDTEDVFELDVTYCAWAEVAKALGNPSYCYYSTCYGDEVFFPHLCAQAGFKFERKGTLAQGAPVCDFTFTRASPQ